MGNREISGWLPSRSNTEFMEWNEASIKLELQLFLSSQNFIKSYFTENALVEVLKIFDKNSTGLELMNSYGFTEGLIR